MKINFFGSFLIPFFFLGKNHFNLIRSDYFQVIVPCPGHGVTGYRSYYLAAQNYPEFPSLEHSMYAYKDFKTVSNYKPLGKFQGSQYMLDIPITNGRAGRPQVVGGVSRGYQLFRRR